MSIDIISTGILVVFAVFIFGREITFVRDLDRINSQKITSEDSVSRGSRLDAYLRFSRDADLPQIESCIKQWEEEKAIRESGKDRKEGPVAIDSSSTEC